MGGAETGRDPGPAIPPNSKRQARLANLSYKAARRIVVAIVGTTLGLVGVILIFTPGPAIVVLTLALAVLSVEFAFARRWLDRLKKVTADTVHRIASDRKKPTERAPGDRDASVATRGSDADGH